MHDPNPRHIGMVRTTSASRIRRRERRKHKHNPMKAQVMRALRNISRFFFGRNVLWWLTDSKRQPPGTKPNPSYNAVRESSKGAS